MDFTSFTLEPGRTADDRVVYVQDLILVLEFVENGHRRTEYVDYLCDCSDSNKHDFFFVFDALLRFFTSFSIDAAFDSIEVWSDGGPHHFKTRWCQWTWHFFSFYFSHKRITRENNARQ